MGRYLGVETQIKTTPWSHGVLNPEGQNQGLSPTEKIKEEVGGEGRKAVGCCNGKTGRAWGRRQEEAGRGGRRGQNFFNSL